MSQNKKPGKGDDLEKFLAAPDEVVLNPAEKRKLQARKAEDAARQAREAFGKSSQEPSIEDMLGDVVRVAEDEETNPYAKFRSISPRRYELYGHYPVQCIYDQWGTFVGAKRAAGLAPEIGTTTRRRARAKKAALEHTGRYVTRHMMPHVGKYIGWDRTAGGRHIALSISDTHATFLSPVVWDCYLQACAEILQAGDTALLNGDILNAAVLSSHQQGRRGDVSFEVEVDFVETQIGQLRAVLAPGVRIMYGLGNHEDMVSRYLANTAREIARLPSMRFDRLLGIDEHDVDLFFGGSFQSPPGQEREKPRRLLYGAMLATHGTKLRKGKSAAQELDTYGCSGTSGHTHRADIAWGGNWKQQNLSWMSTPMGCSAEVAHDYIRDHEGWQQGFGMSIIEGDNVWHHPAIVFDGVCHFGGMRFEARTGADAPRDVMTNWLAEEAR